MTDLKSDLQTIDGIGEVTATQIIEIVEANTESELPKAIEKAYSHAQNGDARMAASYLEQVME